jgi:pimeloyl-ACP methyl ester carboxylesterase
MIARISDPAVLDELLAPFSGERMKGTDYSLRGEGERGTVLLVAGLSMHRTEWSPELLSALRAAKFATLCVDNRDAGLTDLDPSADPECPDYSLSELAGDLVRLVHSLELGPVHVVGLSMGGMIAQHMAMQAPEVVASLTSLMSTTSARGVGRPHEQCKWIFTTEAPRDGEGSYVDYAIRRHRAIAGPRFVDVGRAEYNARIVWARGVNWDGTRRQLAAIKADGDRTARLSRIAVPTLVVHGTTDPMIDYSGGVATAAAIPGARFVSLVGMGHYVPWELAESLARTMVEHFTTV